MLKVVRIIVGFAGFAIATALIGYLLLLAASHVYVSGGFGSWVTHVIDGPFVSDLLDKAHSMGLPGLGDRGLIWVDRVDAGHVPRNLAFLASVAALSTFLLAAAVLLGIAGIGYGLFSADWSLVLPAVLLVVLSPIIFVLALLMAALTWLSLLLQPCTPGYALIWLILGIPFLALGAGLGATPAVGTVIVVHGPISISRG